MKLIGVGGGQAQVFLHFFSRCEPGVRLRLCTGLRAKVGVQYLFMNRTNDDPPTPTLASPYLFSSSSVEVTTSDVLRTFIFYSYLPHPSTFFPDTFSAVSSPSCVFASLKHSLFFPPSHPKPRSLTFLLLSVSVWILIPVPQSRLGLRAVV